MGRGRKLPVLTLTEQDRGIARPCGAQATGLNQTAISRTWRAFSLSTQVPA